MLKKIMAIVLLAVILLSGCSAENGRLAEENNKEYLYGIWVPYTTLNRIAEGDFKSEFILMAQNASSMGANALFVHMRAFADSGYYSKIFPASSWSSSLGFDALSFMIEVCRQYGLQFHAWINPYRVGSADNEVLKNLSAEDYSAVDGKVYFNPASSQVRKLIIDGVKELLEYDLDGIHLDDYFYPTVDAEFDRGSYEKYTLSTGVALELSDYRRANVNTLIAGISSAIKQSGSRAVFSISPAADIEKNYNTLFADVALWCRRGYIDLLIPQLYFGFLYPDERFGFERLVVDWIKLTENTGVDLAIGLAAYKNGTEKEPDRAEWYSGQDIVANELRYIYGFPEISGAVFYAYDALFGEDPKAIEQRKNIEEVIKSKGE